MPTKKPPIQSDITEAGPGMVHAADFRRPGAPSVIWDRERQVVEVELPVELGGRHPVWAVGTFAATGGQLVLVELRFYHPRWSQLPTEDNPEGWPDPGTVEIPNPGVTARMVRAFRLGELFEALQDRPPGEQDWWAARPPDDQTFKAAVEDAARRPGRAGRDDRFYALWAARYVAAGPRAPIATLAKEYPSLGHDRIRDLIHEARSRKLLTRVPKGTAGGQLTELGQRLVEQSGAAVESPAGGTAAAWVAGARKKNPSGETEKRKPGGTAAKSTRKGR